MNELWFILIGALGGAIIAAIGHTLKQRKAGYQGPWFAQVPESRSVSTEVMRRLNLGAILSERNGFLVNAMETGSTPKEAHDWLVGWWAADREAVLFQLDTLLTSGHQRIFDRLLELHRTLPKDRVSAQLHEDFGGTSPSEDLDEFVGYLPGIQHTYLRKAPAHLLANGTAGFDWGRAVTVARVAYTAGWISGEEAGRYLQQVAQLAAERFDDWHQFSDSYMLGRAMWGGAGKPETITAKSIAQRLLSDPESPWNRCGWFA